MLKLESRNHATIIAKNGTTRRAVSRLGNSGVSRFHEVANKIAMPMTCGRYDNALSMHDRICTRLKVHGRNAIESGRIAEEIRSRFSTRRWRASPSPFQCRKWFEGHDRFGDDAVERMPSGTISRIGLDSFVIVWMCFDKSG
jgi:hypothetical protein